METWSLAILILLFLGALFLATSRKRKARPSLSGPQECADPLAENRFISKRALANLRAIQSSRALESSIARTKPEAKTKQRIRSGDLDRVDRRALKDQCLAILGSVAIEHPSGHSKLAARYVLRSEDGNRIELMFEKGPQCPANLWVARSKAEELLNLGIEYHAYEASALYKADDEKLKRHYGRHSALKVMRDLANADLCRFTIERPDQLKEILARLTAA